MLGFFSSCKEEKTEEKSEIKTNFQLKPTDKISSAFFWNGISIRPKIYFFKADSFISYDRFTDQKDVNYPKLITNSWGFKGSFNTKIDASLTNGQYGFYLFSGDKYVTLNSTNSNKYTDTTAKKIDQNWKFEKGFLPSGASLDAACYLGLNYGLFFKGDKVLKYDLDNNETIDVVTISTFFPGIDSNFEKDIDAAFYWGPSSRKDNVNNIYLIKDDKIVTVEIPKTPNLTPGIISDPQPIIGTWPGIGDRWSTFNLAMTSDPQYDYCNSLTCKLAGGAKKTYDDQALSVLNLRNKYDRLNRKFGIVINGDLTFERSSDAVERLSKFSDIGTTFMGLGNHDFGDNQEDVMDFIVNEFGKNKYIKYFDYDVHTKKGSLGYSWDIMNYHFVQLHTNPILTKTFLSENSQSKTLDFLKQDTAYWRGKNVIINMHAMNTSCVPVDDIYDKVFPPSLKVKFQNEFYSILDNAMNNGIKIRAIFLGHMHNIISDTLMVDGYYNPGSGKFEPSDKKYMKKLSCTNSSRSTYGSKITMDLASHKIPVFYCGSAEFNQYLDVEYRPNGMTIRQINSKNGGIEYKGRDAVLSW